MKSIKLYHAAITLILSSCSFFITTARGQAKANDVQTLADKVVYSIITGQESKSDSLLNRYSELVNTAEYGISARDSYLNFKSIYAALFHYDFLLDSFYTMGIESNDIHSLHIRTYIESEYFFKNGNWDESMNSAFKFSTDELTMDLNDGSIILNELSIANIIISRDNNLLKVDTSISNMFNVVLKLFQNKTLDSLNNSILIKFYWASNIVDSRSAITNKLALILLDKLRTFTTEDLAYYESVYSTYHLISPAFYTSRKYVELYQTITDSLSNSKRGYFILNKWFLHLVDFGLFGDSQNESKYFKIETAYYYRLERQIPYYKARRMIEYGIYFGPRNQSTSTTYFTKFYNYVTNDSLIHRQVYRLVGYASFEDISYNLNADRNALTSYIEENKIINGNNSAFINEVYIFGYLDRLAMNGQLKKVDSLLKNDKVIHSYSKEIDSNRSFLLLKAYLKLLDSNTKVNYLLFREAFEGELTDSSSAIVQRIIGDAIEYASFYNDEKFADSLLGIFESIGYAKLRSLYVLNIRRSDLSNLVKDVYVERSFITLYKATNSKSYLIRLLRFKLIREKLINYSGLVDRRYDWLIDSAERNIVLNKVVKDFKYQTGTFNYTPDFAHFQDLENSNIEYIDSLLLEANLRAEKPIDTSNILSLFLSGLENKTVILLGIGSRRRPDDKNLASYVLVIQHSIDSLKLVEVEDSIFVTPFGNYFDVAPNESVKRDRLRFFLKNVRTFRGINEISEICKGKDQVLITGSAMVDQIPFNVILSSSSDLKRVYALGDLSTAIVKEDNLDFEFTGSKVGPKILCLGGAIFDKSDSLLFRSQLKYLPGTLKEALKIKDIFDSCCDVDILTGVEATKEKFLHQVENINYRIIHISTHSFFVEFDPALSPLASIPVSILPERDARSAIYFTGGGDFQRFEAIKRLESYLMKNLILGEMPYLPLHNTKLVVLSSCETDIGLANIYQDVYGNLSISKAFRYAGARYVLGTQWEIGDPYALDFYKSFYDRLKVCGSIEQSFDEAVFALKSKNGDPMIWGCFTLEK